MLGIANWKNQSRSIGFDLNTIGVGESTARDIWADQDIGAVKGNQTINLAAHEMKLWILSNITAPSKLLKSTGYYPATSASLAGSAALTTCSSGTCLPAQKKVSNINQTATVAFHSISAASSGKILVAIDFINYDYATTSAWDWGSNTRNMSISVNGGKAKRWAFPLSGENWYQTGRLNIDVDGFVKGNGNEVVLRAVGDSWAPDLVGLEIFE